ncbi:aldehyde ferredoxin oxidoreductase family protein [Anaerolinea thermophila]|uniref:Aldehyde ferredoxin oxidoreductase n=1 Tax=Anaerolinea thermophila (strain DSM 14523 / JCM 11388 / NBRC 100420 / UNI-1) TaxID=926569 RepID=E8N5N4_ANATU|nr:aldehyde ferredoxin oxidoreductase C-terminal domain-containing protein [Anaerolinea thermophila]BAJ63748.1 putative aldehyde ferredoxin oxidoreductase [Anaerolinea thermophila UNI-1]
MWILRINMTDRSVKFEDVPEKYKYLAGRGLTSQIVYDEVPPLAHPLGPSNKLIFATGIVTGTSAPTSARVSAGGKSPLTGGIKESNAGSPWAHDLAVMRIKALILEGLPEDKKTFWGIHLSWDADAGKPKVDFFDATEYTGKDLYEVAPKLFERFGDRISFAGCGVSGEYGYGNAGIVYNDLAKRPSRYSGRGGLGSVMGSKRVKFIVIDAKGAPGVEIVDKALFDEGRKKMIDAIRSHDITKPKGGLNSFGTAVLVNILNEAGGLPTRNFSSGRFEGAAKIAGEAIFETNKQRLGKDLYNHACSPGCIIQCSNTLYDENGKEITSCVEYESDWALGANCGIDDLDAIGEMVQLCNAYGLDTIETGCTIAVAMEAGVIPFGDAKGAIQLLHEMGKGTHLGRILGAGTETAGKVLGVTRIPAVKGQSMPAYEPRAVKGIGVTYATTTMGADHTAGYTIAPEILSVGGKADPLSNEGKAALSRAFQATTAFIDSSGHCLFIAFPILDIASGYQGMIDECNGVLGTKWTADDVLRIGSEILKVERAFNEAAGFTKAHDRMPEFMKREPLPPHNQVFDVPDEVLDAVYAEL